MVLVIKREVVNQAKGYVEDWSAKNEENLLEVKAEYATRRMEQEPRDIQSLLGKPKPTKRASST